MTGSIWLVVQKVLTHAHSNIRQGARPIAGGLLYNSTRS
ncbi:hypothetical protein CLV75_3941 [Ruegeria conchae]|uniref:Uncharacterized protein n=1 Tax=Ruegeria conchae TaxID=981384 RepID=A0A497Z0F5_9RHOB|nr:hypothetical protein CLV75_3941 [Ruegeria conchae]